MGDEQKRSWPPPLAVGACFFCGGHVQPQCVTVVREWNRQLVVIRDVPAEVCEQCGEQYFGPEAVLGMEQVLDRPEPADETMEVAVHRFERPTIPG